VRRVYLALLVVALAYPLAILAWGREFAAGGAVLIGTFTVGASLLIGLPLALFFIRKGWLKFWHAVITGAVAGLLCTIPFFLGGGSGLANSYLVPFAAVGATHGAAFWLLGFRKNRALPGAVAAESASRSRWQQTPGA